MAEKREGIIVLEDINGSGRGLFGRAEAFLTNVWSVLNPLVLIGMLLMAMLFVFGLLVSFASVVVGRAKKTQGTKQLRTRLE